MKRHRSHLRWGIGCLGIFSAASAAGNVLVFSFFVSTMDPELPRGLQVGFHLANLVLSLLFLTGVYLITTTIRVSARGRGRSPRRLARAAAWGAVLGQTSGEVLAGPPGSFEANPVADLLMTAGLAAGCIAALAARIGLRNERAGPARRRRIPAINAGFAVFIAGLGAATLGGFVLSVQAQMSMPSAASDTVIACLFFVHMGCGLVAALAFFGYALRSR